MAVSERLRLLRDQFATASSQWPNVQSVFVLSPETGDPEPDWRVLAEKKIGMHPFLPAPGRQPDGSVAFIATLLTGAMMDSPACRYRPGHAGTLLYHWDFRPKQFGNNPELPYDIDAAAQWNQRFKLLASAAATELDIELPPGVYSQVLAWKDWTRWQLAVHATVVPRIIELPGDRRAEVVDDITLASAEAIDKWTAPPTPPVPDAVTGWDEATEARNAWLYGQCMKGTPYSSIIRKLDKQPKTWARISSVNGLKKAARAYASRNNLPQIPQRQPGRRS